MYYSLYFAIKNDINFIKDANSLFANIVSKDDCLFKIIAWKYLDRFCNTIYDAKIRELAKQYYSIESDFGRYWLFSYEVLDSSDLDGDWKKMKEFSVSFIDEEKLKTEYHFKSYFYR